jgi:hypothetical protein
MTRDARLSALHRGDFRPGAALPSPALPPDPCSELLAARSSCLAGGVPDLPSPRLRAAAAGRHSLLRLQDRLRRRPSMSEDGNLCTINSLRSQYRSYCVVDDLAGGTESRTRLISCDASPIALAPPEIASVHDEAEVEVRPAAISQGCWCLPWRRCAPSSGWRAADPGPTPRNARSCVRQRQRWRQVRRPRSCSR